ncbi:ABC transporter ATP-binding protein [Actinomadura madurae]|uniref:ABC transporter ATP-binding protein n=1 Tax=Actinomadura madurae TaxID=1993 RepID=UPI003999D0D5
MSEDGRIHMVGKVRSDTAEAAPEAEKTELALSVCRVSAGYEETAVLRDVSLQVEKGSVAALIGANGAGKTTLMKVVAGLLPTTTGRVELYGSDMTHAPQHRRALAGLCHVPEGRAIYRSLSVRENLRMQARPGHERSAIEQGVESFPILGERLDQAAGTLSGGEQQMLAMASVSAREVSLAMFDEPSMGLSPVMVDSVYNFMHKLAGQGVAILVVDQYVHRVLDLANHAYVLARGRITYSGTATSLKSDEVFGHFIGE